MFGIAGAETEDGIAFPFPGNAQLRQHGGQGNRAVSVADVDFGVVACGDVFAVDDQGAVFVPGFEVATVFADTVFVTVRIMKGATSGNAATSAIVARNIVAVVRTSGGVYCHAMDTLMNVVNMAVGTGNIRGRCFTAEGANAVFCMVRIVPAGSWKIAFDAAASVREEEMAVFDAGNISTFSAVAVLVGMTEGAWIGYIHERTAVGAGAVLQEVTIGAWEPVGWKNLRISGKDIESDESGFKTAVIVFGFYINFVIAAQCGGVGVSVAGELNLDRGGVPGFDIQSVFSTVAVNMKRYRVSFLIGERICGDIGKGGYWHPAGIGGSTIYADAGTVEGMAVGTAVIVGIISATGVA